MAGCFAGKLAWSNVRQYLLKLRKKKTKTRYRSVLGSCEHSNEPSRSIKGT
jgi:hypothetical protein